MIVAGNLTLDNQLVYLAQYDFQQSNWQPKAIPGTNETQLHGPATFVLNDFKINGQFFVAGYINNSDGTCSPYLRKWDGSKYRDIGQRLLSNSLITQLSLVYTQISHDSSDILNSDCLLVVTGSLVLDGYGNVSAALYDGQDLYPYLITTLSNGTSGKIIGFYAPVSPDYTNGRRTYFTWLIYLH